MSGCHNPTFKKMPDLVMELINRIHDLEKERDKGIQRIKKLEWILEDLIKANQKISISEERLKNPRRCLTCEGVGKIWEVKVNGIPCFGGAPFQCENCKGKGIIWG